jgi:murein DD-endopeptidase MepM/ murein hydrolase activator NlpD
MNHPLTQTIEVMKRAVLRKMFWGRGNWYRNSFHFFVAFFSVTLLLTGILNRGRTLNTAELAINYGTIGNNDFLAQGSSIGAVVAIEEGGQNYKIFKHTVKSNETLESIAKKYKVDVSTIIWANNRVINPFVPKAQPGITLSIPEINGVLYTVKPGDTVASVVQTNPGSNRFDVIELNQLAPPKYHLKPGTKLFIPNGEAPPAPLPGLDKDFFENPLSHPLCEGYIYQRGFTSYHSGIDLSKWDGCPIRAVAAGKVTFAGWYGAAGYSVIIEHGEEGNSIKSAYYHGNGEMWVKEGDFVKKGQDIMRMGNTGNSTGTHLHISLFKNNQLINPGPLIPY